MIKTVRRRWLMLGILAAASQCFHVQSLSLSPIESVLFRKRQSSIQEAIRFKLEKQMGLPTKKGVDIVAIFPGAGGVDDLTNELEERIRVSDREAGIKEERWIRTIDWKEHRGSVVSAAFDGEAVGSAVAESVSLLEPRSVHCIGISVGAFGAHAMAETMSKLPSKPHVRLTLLDPFCSRGIWGIGYGAKNFGVGADYAEQFLNTDDPVPTTNDPLPNCFCIDVTNAEERETFQLPPDESMHCWPVKYYANYGYQTQTGVDKRVSLLQHDASSKRGTVLCVQ